MCLKGSEGTTEITRTQAEEKFGRSVLQQDNLLTDLALQPAADILLVPQEFSNTSSVLAGHCSSAQSADVSHPAKLKVLAASSADLGARPKEPKDFSPQSDADLPAASSVGNSHLKCLSGMSSKADINVRRGSD